MRTLSLVLSLSTLCLLAAGSSGAQPPAAPQAQKQELPLFQRVIPNPTGMNGYEELVLAAQTLQASRYFELLTKDPPLSVKREMLADPACRRALRLLRQGVAKPVQSPRAQVTFSTLLPELSLFRDLGRLLAVEQYVLLADGKTSEAVGQVRLCFRFAEAIQTDTLISGLMGVAVGTLCLQPLIDHLDQLAVRDLQALQAVCLEWLAKPSPLVRVIQAERFWMRGCLAEISDIAKRKGLLAAAREIGIDPSEAQPFLSQVPTSNAELDRLLDDVHQRMEEHYVTVLSELKKPAWQRHITAPPEGSDLAGFASRALMTDFGTLDDRYTQEAARVRLLACHAAIRRYRWEHDRLPESLAVLRLGELALDPFNGAPLQYVRRDRRYSLTSIGAPTTNADDPRQIDGRIPVALTPDD